MSYNRLLYNETQFNKLVQVVKGSCQISCTNTISFKKNKSCSFTCENNVITKAKISNIQKAIFKRRNSYFFPSEVNGLKDDSIGLHYKLFNIYKNMSQVDQTIENTKRAALQELDAYGIKPTNIDPIYSDQTNDNYVGEWFGYSLDENNEKNGQILIVSGDSEVVTTPLIIGDRRFISVDTTDKFFKQHKGKFAIYLGEEL